MATVRSQCETKKAIYGGITDLEDLCNNLDECAIPRLFINNPVHEYEDFLMARRKLMAERLRIYYANL